MRTDRLAIRLVVDGEKFRQLLGERGFKNVEEIAIKSREEEGKSLGISTIYAILGNANFQRDSLERLAEVVGVDLSEFVSFEPESDSLRRV